MLYLIVFISSIFLAFSNGANDNFKGVSTLFGSGTTDFRKALIWATITTGFGSIASIFLASILVKNFSGKGLVPDEFISLPQFTIAIALGAASTVMLATRFGMPISTTHSLVGALTGVGFVAAGNQFNYTKLGNSFFLPLILSPFIAAIISLSLYFVFKKFREISGITKESCLCVSEPNQSVITVRAESLTMNNAAPLQITTGTLETCNQLYRGTIIGLSAQKVLDTLHYLSSGAVSFARGLNDTPKIVGLLLIINSLDIKLGAIVVSIAIALGGILKTKKVAETMSKKITVMNHGQGFTANLTTAVLVSTASFSGLPVSTTHVSVGSLGGIGIISGGINFKTVKNIILSWVLTLPVAAIISSLIFLILNKF